MTGWTSIVAGALALTLSAAAPAAAQDPSPEQQVAEATAQLMEKLRGLSEGLGIDPPPLPEAAIASALARALPMLPADDPELSWASGFAFEFKTNHTTGELEPDEDGRAVLTDARGCLREDEVAEVVHFERFTRGEVRGHRCVTSVGGASSENVWALQSRTFAEGPDGRLTAFYAVATSIDGDRDSARRLLEERLEENVDLAGVLADYALEMFVNRAASADPVTMDNLAERTARLQARLAEIADRDEPATPPAAP